jgi:acetolactate synthase regulatory subunit
MLILLGDLIEGSETKIKLNIINIKIKSKSERILIILKNQISVIYD